MKMPLYINKIFTDPLLGNCDITFQKGLNIIYAKKLDAFTNTPNSVGKTTLVNLIDFGLGKTNFLSASKKKNKEVKKFFKDVSIILEIMIFEKKYTIVRSILNDEIIQVFNEWDIKNRNLNSINYELDSYRNFLENELYGSNLYYNDKKIITIRSLLKFLIRDQKTGFIKYNAYMPNESGKICSNRLDFLLGKMDPELKHLEERIKVLDTNISETDKKNKILSDYFFEVDDRKKMVLRAAKNKNLKEIKLIQDNIKITSEKIMNIEDKKNNITIQKNDLNHSFRKLNDEIFLIKEKIKDYNLGINEVKNEIKNINYINYSMEILNPFKLSKCPIYLKNIKANEDISPCPFIEDDLETKENKNIIAARKKLLEFEKNDLRKAILNLEKIQEIKNKNSEILKIKMKELDKVITSENEELLFFLNNLKDKESNLNFENRKIDNTLDNLKLIDKLKTILKGYRKEKRELTQTHKELDLKIKENITLNFETIYHEIVDFITNHTRIGEIIPQKLEPQVLFSSNSQIDSGAAMSVVKIIAYDLALLKLSLKNKKKNIFNNHPLLLIHDSPKLHDIQLEMYNKIFDYIIKLQENIKYKDIPFQYIITTLDISQKVKDDEDEYIVLELNNSGEGGKLFGKTIDV